MTNMTFSVSQSSVATQLTFGGKHDTGFIANFLIANFVLSPSIKKYENWPTFA